MLGEPVEEGGGHRGVAEDTRPLTEGKTGGDDHRGLLGQPADQVEEELSAALGDGQGAEFVEGDAVERGQVATLQPVSPLSRAARPHDMLRLSRALEVLNAHFGAKTTATIVDSHKVAEELRDRLGIADVICSPEEIAELAQRAATAQAGMAR